MPRPRFPVPSPTVAGSAQTFTVTVKDRFGNIVPTYSGTVTFSSSDSQAVLPAAQYTFIASDNGSHTFTATLATVKKTGQTITVTDTNGIHGKETGIQVTPGAAVSLVIAGFPSSVVAGTGHGIAVTAKDAYGNIATGYTGTVSFSSTDNKAVLPAAYTFAGTDAGVHHFYAVKLKTVGTQSITVQDTINASLTATEANIIVDPV
jgi:hypothetical protein